MKAFVLDPITCSVQGHKMHSFPSTKPALPRCNRVSPAKIFFWPNCCQWLNPIHLHRSPLKRDADELNECANYARSAWGACCNRNFVCVCVYACVCAYLKFYACAGLGVCFCTWKKQPDIKRSDFTWTLFNGLIVSVNELWLLCLELQIQSALPVHLHDLRENWFVAFVCLKPDI